MTRAELQDVRTHAERLHDTKDSSSISVAVFEREEHRPEDLSEMDGLTVAMTAQMREALSDYCLTYAGGRFALKSPEETLFSLRSVKTLAKWFE